MLPVFGAAAHSRHHDDGRGGRDVLGRSDPLAQLPSSSAPGAPTCARTVSCARPWTVTCRAGLRLSEYEILSMLSESPHAPAADVGAGRPGRCSRAAGSPTPRSGSRSAAGWCASPARTTGGACCCVSLPTGLAQIEAVAPVHVESVRRHLVDLLSPAQFAALGEAMAGPRGPASSAYSAPSAPSATAASAAPARHTRSMHPGPRRCSAGPAVTPGGVNSPGAGLPRGGWHPPLHGERPGPYLTDADGRRVRRPGLQSGGR